MVTAILLVAAGFFVALALGLLVRYSQVSRKITDSTDLGRDLWQALEQRMERQDERILDVMGRLEVIQARVLAAAAMPAPAVPPSPVVQAPQPQPASEAGADVMSSITTMQQPESHLESRSEPQMSQTSEASVPEIQLDETQLKVISLLSESQKNTRQLTDAIGLSREHTARLMKGLFEAGLVTRNDATKPFVYQLTDQGRQHLPVGPA